MFCTLWKKIIIFLIYFSKNCKGGPLQFLKKKIQKIKKSCKGGPLQFFQNAKNEGGDI